MDTSETYIKMCEKAEEIQKLAPREAKMDDPHYFEQHNFIADSGGRISPEDDGYFFGLDKVQVWLPRQDQLQEMLDYRKIGLNYPVKSGWLTPLPPTLMAIQDFLKSSWVWESWEQLWLAFVMYEKYNKTWDGEDWK